MASNNKHDTRLYKMWCKCGKRLDNKYPGQSAYCDICNHWVQLPKDEIELQKHEVDRVL